MLEHAREGREGEAAALADVLGAERRKHRGHDDEAGDERHERIHRADERRVLAEVLMLGQIRAVGDHDGHAQRQGEERLPQRREEGVEADLAPVAAEHIGEADLRAVERDGAREQYNENDEQRGHTDLVELLDAALNALDDDEGVDCHKDRGKEKGGQREPCLARRGVVAEQAVEIAERIGIDRLRLRNVGHDIAQHPAADVAVIGGDDERHRNTRDADPLEAGIGLCGTADGQLREHDGEADENDDGQINEDVGASASLKGLAGELPDVAEADGAARRRQDEAASNHRRPSPRAPCAFPAP